jgi:thimet oligopeptidase
MRTVRKSCAMVCLLAGAATLTAQSAPTAMKPADPLHAWVGLHKPADLENWVRWQIGEEQRMMAGMLAVKGPRTEANTLEPFDRASEHLTLAGDQAQIMFEVNPDKDGATRRRSWCRWFRRSTRA